MTEVHLQGNESRFPFAVPVGMWPKKWAEKRPDKLAIVDLYRGQQCTYRDLHIRSNILANALLARGLKKGDKIAVILENCIPYMELYFACAKLDVILMPVNYRLSPPEWKYQIGLVEPSVVIVGEEFLDKFSDLTSLGVNFAQEDVYCLRLPHGDRALPYKDYALLVKDSNSKDVELDWDINIEDIQIVMFTSGTTRVPKGAMLSYRKNFYCTVSDALELDMLPEDRWLLSLPLYHSGGMIIEAVPALYMGATLFMKRGKPEEFLEAIENNGLTKWFAITYHGRAIASIPDIEKKYRLESFKQLILGGEPVPASLAETLQKKWPHLIIRTLYGATEASCSVVVPAKDARRKAGSCGIPVFFAQARVVDDNDRDVKQGEIGELIVNGPIRCSGYWRDPETTREIFKGGWFHTGDLARMDEEGFIYIVDRKKDMIISGGENIHSSEVEAVVRQHPKVEEVAVIGVPDERWGERPIAIVMPKGGQGVTTEEIREFCQGKLAKFKIPDRVELTSELPLVGPGKIAKWRLREEYGGGIAK